MHFLETVDKELFMYLIINFEQVMKMFYSYIFRGVNESSLSMSLPIKGTKFKLELFKFTKRKLKLG